MTRSPRLDREDSRTANSHAENTLTYDAAGNLTYDGLRMFEYDAWNRLTAVKTGYLDSNGALQTGATIGTIKYDALGRRIVKAIENSGDWDCTYNYHHDGRSVIETRNGSNQDIKYYVRGMQYPDEVSLPKSPSAST